MSVYKTRHHRLRHSESPEPQASRKERGFVSNVTSKYDGFILTPNEFSISTLQIDRSTYWSRNCQEFFWQLRGLSIQKNIHFVLALIVELFTIKSYIAEDTTALQDRGCDWKLSPARPVILKTSHAICRSKKSWHVNSYIAGVYVIPFLHLMTRRCTIIDYSQSCIQTTAR